MRRLLKWLLAIGAVIALSIVPLPWPEQLMGSHIVNAIDVAAPPERVFAYVATPANWPRWHPASRAVRGVVDRTPAVGESVVETFEIVGRRGDATWTTRELDPPRLWRFDAKSAGGGGAHITYRMTATGDGTRFERDLRYFGGNLLFGVLDVLQIHNVMETDSTLALLNVKRDVEAATRH